MLLTQNRELKKDGVWNWTLPAWVVELPDGSHFNVCPHAGACAKFCYARNGTYLFPKVRGKHLDNLLCVLLPTTRVGIPQNNIPHFRKKLDGRTFSEAQRERVRK